MRSSTVVALFAGSAAAQSSAVVFNPVNPMIAASTLTVLGSSSGTTTYVNSCSEPGIPTEWLSSATATSGSAASHFASSARSAAGTLALTPISAPSTTPAPRLRRQDDSLFGDFCEPFTLKQGSSALEFHLEDPTKDVWTADIKCGWKGEMTTADLTCTVTQSGVFPSMVLSATQDVETSTLKASELVEDSQIMTVSVVQATSGSASAKASGSQSGAANATSTASGSGAPAATGAAAGAPLSKGVMAFVGGAAGVFAAALAL